VDRDDPRRKACMNLYLVDWIIVGALLVALIGITLAVGAR